MKEFFEMIELDAKELKIKFERSSIEGKGTSQEIADFREHALQSFVSKYFPFPFRISKGGIYDRDGNRSNSIDCLVLNPNHPNTVDSHGKHSLILAEGVEVAIEVKPDISNKKELERALVQGDSIKNLNRVWLADIKPDEYESVSDLAKQIPYFIFSMKAKTDLVNTIKEVEAFYEQHKVPRINQAEGIVIFNRGILMNYKHKSLYPWSKNWELAKDSWVFENWEENTLAGFLLHINNVYSTTTRFQRPIIRYYFNSLSIGLTSYEKKRITPVKDSRKDC